MALSCGIIGLPNVGKSTLFNALTASGVQAENYPFCTIEPNIGIVPLPDERLIKLGHAYRSTKITPTTVHFVDIAGLVEGASHGEGLGNQFLAHIRQVSALIHVVRCFSEPHVTHVNGSVDPLRDITVVNTELLLKDIETVQRRIENICKRRYMLEAESELHCLERLALHLNSNKPARTFEARDGIEQEVVDNLFLLTAKPILYVANTDESGFKIGNYFTNAVTTYAHNDGADVLVLCGKLEAELASLPHEEQEYFLQEIGIDRPVLQRLIHSAYHLLDLITFFTAGSKETRAWTIKQGTKAQQAAGVIHSDFERGFIRAEVMSYLDWERLGSEQAVRESGLYRVEGKDYIIADGDIVYFRFNV